MLVIMNKSLHPMKFTLSTRKKYLVLKFLYSMRLRVAEIWKPIWLAKNFRKAIRLCKRRRIVRIRHGLAISIGIIFVVIMP
jgi:hypothetical protein